MVDNYATANGERHGSQAVIETGRTHTKKISTPRTLRATLLGGASLMPLLCGSFFSPLAGSGSALTILAGAQTIFALFAAAPAQAQPGTIGQSGTFPATGTVTVPSGTFTAGTTFTDFAIPGTY